MAKESTAGLDARGGAWSAKGAVNYVTLIATDRSGQQRDRLVERYPVAPGLESAVRAIVSARRSDLLADGYTTRPSVFRAHPDLPYPTIGEA
jgi:hypothetical protein